MMSKLNVMLTPYRPDDDHVLACALAADAELIVSGGKHLLGLGAFKGIEIITAAQALERISDRRSGM